MLVSARNEQQLSTIAEEVEHQVKEGLERRPRRREGAKDTGWMLLDYGDVVIHVFTEEQREYYNLERLWSDAPVLDFQEGTLVSRPAADGSSH